MPEEVKKDEPKKKGILGKLKEAADDKEEQLAILSTFVRLRYPCLEWRNTHVGLHQVATSPWYSRTKTGSDFYRQRFYWGFGYFWCPGSKESRRRWW